MTASDYIIQNARYLHGLYVVVLPNGRTLKATDTMKLVQMAAPFIAATAPARSRT